MYLMHSSEIDICGCFPFQLKGEVFTFQCQIKVKTVIYKTSDSEPDFGCSIFWSTGIRDVSLIPLNRFQLVWISGLPVFTIHLFSRIRIIYLRVSFFCSYIYLLYGFTYYHSHVPFDGISKMEAKREQDCRCCGPYVLCLTWGFLSRDGTIHYL